MRHACKSCICKTAVILLISRCRVAVLSKPRQTFTRSPFSPQKVNLLTVWKKTRPDEFGSSPCQRTAGRIFSIRDFLAPRQKRTKLLLPAFLRVSLEILPESPRGIPRTNVNLRGVSFRIERKGPFWRETSLLFIKNAHIF
jgi:hypothetical protein